jgi:hypothetical protein
VAVGTAFPGRARLTCFLNTGWKACATQVMNFSRQQSSGSMKPSSQQNCFKQLVKRQDDGPHDIRITEDQDDDEAHRLQVVVKPGELPGEHQGQDVGAVQGRDGNQVKNRE